MSQRGFVNIYRQRDDELIKAVIVYKSSYSFSTKAELASLYLHNRSSLASEPRPFRWTQASKHTRTHKAPFNRFDSFELVEKLLSIKYVAVELL